MKATLHSLVALVSSAVSTLTFAMGLTHIAHRLDPVMQKAQPAELLQVAGLPAPPCVIVDPDSHVTRAATVFVA